MFGPRAEVNHRPRIRMIMITPSSQERESCASLKGGAMHWPTLRYTCPNSRGPGPTPRTPRTPRTSASPFLQSYGLEIRASRPACRELLSGRGAAYPALRGREGVRSIARDITGPQVSAHISSPFAHLPFQNEDRLSRLAPLCQTSDVSRPMDSVE